MTSQRNTLFDAVIIGAGFSGLYQLHRLKKNLGMSAIILESGDGVGGTWYWNRYPGARCDSESYSYCYYFSDEILDEWSWKEKYPNQEEIEKYLNFVAKKLNLFGDIKFGSKVVKMLFNETENNWTIYTSRRTKYKSRFVIAAVGCLSAPNFPNIYGMGTFKGNLYHTAKWPKKKVSFNNQSVGIIGTGATGIQIIPEIAPRAKKLSIFQRTPNFSVPARNCPLSEDFIRFTKLNKHKIKEKMLSSRHGHPFDTNNRSAKSTPPKDRDFIYEKAWKVGGLRFRDESFSDLMLDRVSNETACEFLKKKIREIVVDPQNADDLSSIVHPFAAKRPPIDTNYFETYNRSNVELINLKKEPLQRIAQNGIFTKNRFFYLDSIILATGFDAITGALSKIDIIGLDGQTLEKTWAQDPITNLGIQVPGFPNMFLITGPGSPSVLTNMPRSIEQHVDWITDCINYCQSNNYSLVETTREAASNWLTEVQRAADATLFSDAKDTWYHGANIPGKPRAFMPYAGGLDNFTRLCDEVVREGYKGFNLR